MYIGLIIVFVIVPLIFISLLIWGITMLIKSRNSSSKRSPIDIAKERYSKGEISRDEFEQIKNDLS